ncbi:MAG: thiamine-phosphate kinase [Salinarimonas sp.]|nr:thiamine-phosphate kinase [Salinarimonas sp.]
MNAEIRLSEDALISRYFAPIAGDGGFGMRDDAAMLTPGEGSDLVVTVDALVAGVHFLPDDPPASIARKALAVNLSDLAAKGARPRGHLLSIALEEGWREDWLAAFTQGLGHAARAFGCPLLGGDTVRANGAYWLSITALGEVPRGEMVHRFTAQAGDVLCVSGTIGDAVLGLALRSGTTEPWALNIGIQSRVFLTDRFLHPQPRIALADILRRKARAAMDVSDGLVGDLAKMCRASDVSAEVDLEKLPLSSAARTLCEAHRGLRDKLVTGGDDYEILCAVAPENLEAFLTECAQTGIAMTPIGHFRPRDFAQNGCLPIFSDANGQRRYEKGSYSHF